MSKTKNDELNHAYVLGNHFFKKGIYSKSAEYYKMVIRLKKNSKEAWEFLGYSLSFLGDNKSAIKCLRKAITLDSEDSIIWSKIGDICHDQKHYKKSILCYKKAIKIDPKFEKSLCSIGIVYPYLKLNQYSKALKVCESALKSHSRDVRVINLKGLTFLHMKRYEEAMQEFLEGIKIEKKSYLWDNLGFTFYKNHQISEGITCCKKALRLDSTSIYTLLNLGLMYFKLGNYSKSKDFFEKARAINENIEEILFEYYSKEDLCDYKRFKMVESKSGIKAPIEHS